MTVSNAIAELRHWLKSLAPVFQPTRSQTKTIARWTRDYLFIYFHAFNNLRATARRGDWFMALCGSFVIGRSHHFVLRQWFRSRFVMCAIATYHYSMEHLRTSEIPVVRVGRDLNSGSPDLQPCSLSSRSWYPSSWMENKNWTSSLLSTFHVTTVILNLRLFFRHSVPKAKWVFQGFWRTREHWLNIEVNKGTWTYFGGTGEQNFTN